MIKTTLILVMICLTYHAAKAQQTTLVQNGASSYRIVLPAQPTNIESTAANELKNYINQSSGAVLSITSETGAKNTNNIYIGNTKAAQALQVTKSVANDGFAIVNKAGNIYISGKQGKGTLYGVNRFLELYFGVDYLSATDIIVPAHPNVSVPQSLNLTSNPAFITRDDFTDMGFNGKWHNNTRDYSGGYKDWHCITHAMPDWDKESQWGLFGHTFFKLVPPKTYFASHPDYYSLIDGKRQSQQLNLSNPEVANIVIQNLKEQMKANPSALYWMVGQEDGGKWCQCDACTKAYQKYGGNKSGLMIEFINKIAQAIPDKQIATFAYGETEAPPQNIKPLANVLVVSAPIGAHHDAPLTSAENQHWSGYMKQWSTLVSHYMVWDYYADFTDILTPAPNLAPMASNFRFYKSLHAQHVFAQRPVFMPGSDMEELKSYVLAKLMWNPNLNQDSLVSSFTDKYYGNAGKYIVQYLTALNNNLQKAKAGSSAQDNAVTDNHPYLSPSLLKQYNDIFDEATNAVKDNPGLWNRVNNARFGVDFFLAKTIKNKGEKSLQGLSEPAIAQMKQRFKNSVKRLNIKFTADANQKPIDAYLSVYSAKDILPQTLAGFGFAASGIYVRRRIKRKRNKNKPNETESI